MNILDALLAAQGGGAVRQLGRQFGLDDDQASAALAALVPALAAGMARNASADGGLAGLAAALSGGRHGQYLDDLGSLTRPETVADGNGILGHVFGSKDVSRQVAARAATSSGLGADLMKKMLPVVAAMMMGALAKNAGGAGAAAAGRGAPPGGMGGGLLDMLSPMLDRNRDGSVADDVAGMLGKLLGGR
jgi:hypothetical protein